MSHDAKVLLGREVEITLLPDHWRKEKGLRIIATSSSDKGTIFGYIMNKRGRVRCIKLRDIKFLKVWDYELKQLVDAE